VLEALLDLYSRLKPSPEGPDPDEAIGSARLEGQSCLGRSADLSVDVEYGHGGRMAKMRDDRLDLHGAMVMSAIAFRPLFLSAYSFVC
jgi:hypothetical protein